MIYFDRELEKKIKEASQFFPVVVVTGARQVGKSTMLRHIFQNYRYVTLDKQIDAEIAQEDPESFLATHPAPVIIDEIQYAPNLFRYIKAQIDLQREVVGSYILTGSQKFSQMKGVADSLAGRVAVFELEGLSQREISQKKHFDHSLENYVNHIVRGSFPQIWKEPNIPLDLYYSSYTSTYLERDVRDVLAVNNLRDFERFVRACAIRTGQVLNKADNRGLMWFSPVSEALNVH